MFTVEIRLVAAFEFGSWVTWVANVDQNTAQAELAFLQTADGFAARIVSN